MRWFDERNIYVQILILAVPLLLLAGVTDAIGWNSSAARTAWAAVMVLVLVLWGVRRERRGAR